MNDFYDQYILDHKDEIVEIMLEAKARMVNPRLWTKGIWHSKQNRHCAEGHIECVIVERIGLNWKDCLDPQEPENSLVLRENLVILKSACEKAFYRVNKRSMVSINDEVTRFAVMDGLDNTIRELKGL